MSWRRSEYGRPDVLDGISRAAPNLAAMQPEMFSWSVEPLLIRSQELCRSRFQYIDRLTWPATAEYRSSSVCDEWRFSRADVRERVTQNQGRHESYLEHLPAQIVLELVETRCEMIIGAAVRRLAHISSSA